jgi:putative polyketide hydroxylase
VLDDLYLELGYRYASPAVIAEPAGEPETGELPHRHPRDCRGQPGSRAPHVWLHRRGELVSALDLFGGNFVLLAGPRGAAWRDAAREAAGRLGLGLDAYLVNDGTGELEDAGSDFGAAYGISPDGAVLVRPDGFVAWRAADAADATAGVMTAVLSRALCQPEARA